MLDLVAPALQGASGPPDPGWLEVTGLLEKINERCNFHLADDFQTTKDKTLLSEEIPTFLMDTGEQQGRWCKRND
jgi:hypothetical protein